MIDYSCGRRRDAEASNFGEKRVRKVGVHSFGAL